MGASRLPLQFYTRDVLHVAPELLGTYLVIRSEQLSGEFLITETEAYRGAEDLACHASKGRTTRTEIMYQRGGHLYMYLIYGMYWMLNVVTGEKNRPQAALIRGLKGLNGPGKLTRALGLDRSYYGEDLVSSPRIWIRQGLENPDFITGPRIGIEYAGDPWKKKPWRFCLAGE
jgi:DNA-3-methyladenine glycosylase